VRVTVNGEAREVEDGTTLGTMLRHLQMPTSRIAVERNGEVVTREAFEQVMLTDGDRIEVVRFVGGGN